MDILKMFKISRMEMDEFDTVKQDNNKFYLNQLSKKFIYRFMLGDGTNDLNYLQNYYSNIFDLFEGDLENFIYEFHFYSLIKRDINYIKYMFLDTDEERLVNPKINSNFSREQTASFKEDIYNDLIKELVWEIIYISSNILYNNKTFENMKNNENIKHFYNLFDEYSQIQDLWIRIINNSTLKDIKDIISDDFDWDFSEFKRIITLNYSINVKNFFNDEYYLDETNTFFTQDFLYYKNTRTYKADIDLYLPEKINSSEDMLQLLSYHFATKNNIINLINIMDTDINRPIFKELINDNILFTGSAISEKRKNEIDSSYILKNKDIDIFIRIEEFKDLANFSTKDKILINIIYSNKAYIYKLYHTIKKLYLMMGHELNKDDLLTIILKILTFFEEIPMSGDGYSRDNLFQIYQTLIGENSFIKTNENSFIFSSNIIIDGYLFNITGERITDEYYRKDDKLIYLRNSKFNFWNNVMYLDIINNTIKIPNIFEILKYYIGFDKNINFSYANDLSYYIYNYDRVYENPFDLSFNYKYMRNLLTSNKGKNSIDIIHAAINKYLNKKWDSINNVHMYFKIIENDLKKMKPYIQKEEFLKYSIDKILMYSENIKLLKELLELSLIDYSLNIRSEIINNIDIENEEITYIAIYSEELDKNRYLNSMKIYDKLKPIFDELIK